MKSIFGIRGRSWNSLNWKKKKRMEESEEIIPQWHKDLVTLRLEEYNLNLGPVLDFDKSMDDIENGL